MEKLTTDGTKGGLLVGKTDIDGGVGIPATVGGSRSVLLGGGEIIINEAAATIHCEKLSEINESTGGRHIDCDDQKTANKGKFNAGGLTPKKTYYYHVALRCNRQDIQKKGFVINKEEDEEEIWLSDGGKSLKAISEDDWSDEKGGPQPELDIWQIDIPESNLNKIESGYDMGKLGIWSAYAGNIPSKWITLIDEKNWVEHYVRGGRINGTTKEILNVAEVEEILGRKLGWFNDYTVVLDGIKYEKMGLLSTYKRKK